MIKFKAADVLRLFESLIDLGHEWVNDVIWDLDNDAELEEDNVFDDFAGDMVKTDFTRTQEIYEWLSRMDYYKDIEMEEY